MAIKLNRFRIPISKVSKLWTGVLLILLATMAPSSGFADSCESFYQSPANSKPYSPSFLKFLFALFKSSPNSYPIITRAINTYATLSGKVRIEKIDQNISDALEGRIKFFEGGYEHNGKKAFTGNKKFTADDFINLEKSRRDSLISVSQYGLQEGIVRADYVRKKWKKTLDYLAENAPSVNYFHGSSSASLLLFSKYKHLGGLLSGNKIKAAGITPLSGERVYGASFSDRISAVSILHLDLAIRYSKSQFANIKVMGLLPDLKPLYNGQSWTPELSQLRIHLLERLEKESPGYYFSAKAIRLCQEEIERSNVWTQLNREEQQIVEVGIPVVYGVDVPVSRLSDGSTLDHVDIEGGVNHNEIKTLFVPSKDIIPVRDFLQRNGFNIPVLPLERIEPKN